MIDPNIHHISIVDTVHTDLHVVFPIQPYLFNNISSSYTLTINIVHLILIIIITNSL